VIGLGFLPQGADVKKRAKKTPNTVSPQPLEP